MLQSKIEVVSRLLLDLHYDHSHHFWSAADGFPMLQVKVYDAAERKLLEL
jgi:hypothetical protein